MTRAFGYLRVSGKGQVGGDGFPRQRAAIEAYCAGAGIEVVEWFEEQGVSGTVDAEDRPTWSMMLERIVGNGVRTVVIEKMDRLARDLIVQEKAIWQMKRLKVDLVSTAEPDLGSEEPGRVMIRQIIGAVAQNDKSTVVLRLRSARRKEKALNGRCEGRKPYGDKPGEAEVLEKIVGMHRQEATDAAITRWLNDNNHRARGGGKWLPAVVGRILKRMGE